MQKTDHIKTYLVGGAVRDQWLGLEVKDRDWVVTGALPEDMIAAGFEQVGKSFPVFLHPETREEYALARTERKIAKGYQGFSFNTDRKITLKEDLIRRDLTINALAQDEEGNIIDYFGGVSDLENRVLRHVSSAFGEDPVRVLRVARFAARFHDLGFTVAPETMQLMRKMVRNGEVDALISERVWQELDRALGEAHPEQFILTLHDCEALDVLFPEIERLFGVPQVAAYHPEIDTGLHTLMVMEQAVKLSSNRRMRFACLLHDLGKGVTPDNILPHHYGHEETGAKLAARLCKRLRVPTKYRQLAVLVARYHTHIHKALVLKPKTILKVLYKCDAYHQPERFSQLLLACEADARGRAGLENRPYPQRQFFEQAAHIARKINSQALIEQGFKGKQLGEELHKKRLHALKSFIAKQPQEAKEP